MPVGIRNITVNESASLPGVMMFELSLNAVARRANLVSHAGPRARRSRQYAGELGLALLLWSASGENEGYYRLLLTRLEDPQLERDLQQFWALVGCGVGE